MFNSRPELQAAIAPLVEPLHEAFGTAWKVLNNLASTSAHLSGRYPAAMAHFIRFEALHAMGPLLRESAGGGDWSVAGNPRRNGEFWLQYGTDATVRILKEQSGQRIPHAGSNRARQAFYRDALQRAFFGPGAEGGGLGPNFLALWDDTGGGEFSFRLVQPIGTGSYRSRVPVSLDMPLLAPRTAFESLTFEVNDEMDDFLLDEIHDEDQGE